MDKGQIVTCEDVIATWNVVFPQYTLELEDLKKPHALMEALFRVFEKLGIDREFFLAPPSEECFNESTTYFRDLLPVINVARAWNHLLSGCQQADVHKISIMHFLQPTLDSSKTIILVPLNLIIFYENRLKEIGPKEEALFAKAEHVKALESLKKRKLEMLNKQAEEKGKRAENLEQLNHDVKKLEKELKNEKEVHNKEKQELEPIIKQNQQAEHLVKQKKYQLDAIMTEVARRKALRVYDADDIRTQAEQASQNVQEAEEKLNTLRSTLMKKETSLNNLQGIKPNLDTANNFLHEITKLTDTLKENECGDLDSDSKEGELEVLNTELSELQVQLSELQAARAEAAEAQRENEAKRESEMSQVLSELREVEEDDKKCKMAEQEMEELKQLTLKYEEEKTASLKELDTMKSDFCANLKSVEDTLIKKTKEVEKHVIEKLQRKNKEK